LTTPIEGVDFFVYYMKMPKGIYAFVMPNSDGTYSMFLDPRRSRDQQLEDYIHELTHIVREDFYNDLPIQIVEAS
jgi:hypothetical protein